MSNVIHFPPRHGAGSAAGVAETVSEMAQQLEGAHGAVVVADMGAGDLRIFVAGAEYDGAADALFLLALGQKKILEAGASS